MSTPRSNTPRVLVTVPLREAGEALLDARPDVEVVHLPEQTVTALDAVIGDIDAAVLSVLPFGAATAAKARRLKVVSRFGVGYDAVDVAALTAHGIPLTVVGEANAVTVAEHAMAMLLAVLRRLKVADQKVRDGRFRDKEAPRQRDLAGKTVLVVGHGRIGRRLARRLAAFDADVIVADPYADRGPIEAAGHRWVADFRAVLGQADIVTLHLPGQADGSPVMTAAAFAAMRPGSYFVNVSRGSLVDEAALYDALTRGALAGAGLDVFRDEPPPLDHPLLTLDNVLVSPHSASSTEECWQRMSAAAVQNALDGLDGTLDPAVVINREVLP